MDDTNNNLIDDKVELSVNSERLQSELNRDKLKWKVRRSLALVAFTYNLIVGLLYFIFVFFLNNDQATMLKDYNSVIISIIGANFSIVMLYIGAVTYSDTLENKLNMTSNKDA